MSTSKPAYHHGDLRPALLAAAAALLAEQGVTGLSLRAVARGAGVSAMAPYRHFADKAALLAALAEDGFRRLESVLTAAAGATAPDRLRAQGVAYVGFALAEPALFRLMFGPEIGDKAAHPGLAAAGAAAFAVLEEGVAACRPDAAPAARAEMALACWSLAHGTAALAVDGRLPGDAARLTGLADRLGRLLIEGLRAG